MKRLARHPVLLALVAVAAIAALVTPLATAERSQVGNLIVSLNGGIHPRTLPRHDPAPVGVHLSGRVVTADKTPVPRVNWIRLELAWRGVLHTKGLPVCPQSRLAGRLSEQAMRACRVGAGRPRGALRRDLRPLPGAVRDHRPPPRLQRQDESGPARGAGPRLHRGPAGLVRDPVHGPQSGPIQNDPDHDDPEIDRALAPRRRLPRRDLTEIQLPGHRVSYLSASCPVPKGFTAGFLSFARATYTFEGGKQLRTESVRSCRAR